MKYTRILSAIAGGLVIAAAASCSGDDGFNTEGFIPVTEPLYYGSISPEVPFDAFEFRLADCGSLETFSISYTENAMCEQAEDPVRCQAELEAFTPNGPGFNPRCLPGCCVNYVLAESGGELRAYDSTEKLLEFLGTINTISDALIWVQAAGFYFTYDDVSRSGIREQRDGSYRVIALQLMEVCAPIVTDRVLLEVGPDGSIRELDRREDSRDANACI